MKTWDAIIIGAGIIGLSLAIELRKRGLSVLIVEKGAPGREASWAAGGMLCDSPLETSPTLQELATASARMYPEFVQQLQHASGLTIDLRSQGTLLMPDPHSLPAPLDDLQRLHPLPAPIDELEPALRASSPLLYLQECCVDPRHLVAAAVAAARHHGVDIVRDSEVCSLRIVNQKAAGVSLPGSHLGAGMVVNCAGAWARQIAPHRVPTHPVRGQMLCVALPEPEFLRHVVRTPDVYLIPRSDGRLLIGATAEDAGFDKQTVPATLQKLRQAAIDLVPPIGHAPVLEAWAGLRPGTPDKLPILGTTPTPGYFVATGHFRDGILLAPATAHVMAQLITGERPGLDLQPFRLERFEALHEETRLLPDHDTQNQDVQEQDRHNTEDIQNENARSFSRH